MRILLFILTSLVAFVAQAQDSLQKENDLLTGYKVSWLEQELGIPLSEDGNLMLYDTIASWLGTPYRFAGSCEKGIDCSGFVNVLFDRVYGKRLGARNSAEIYNSIYKLDRSELQEGDLVFFRIYRHRISHVGLYLGNNKFVHASTSRGVIISDLDEPYYRRYFAGAGRYKADALSETPTNP
ncbi:MAG: NlpC/P60 family protein [Bacteroidia bacterium]